MKPHELDTLEQMAAHTSVREALLVAYHTGRADAFIERAPSPLMSLVDRVEVIIRDADRLPLGWIPEVEDGRG